MSEQVKLVFPGDPPPELISPEQTALLVELGAARVGTNFVRRA